MESEKVKKVQQEDIFEKYKKLDKLGLIKYKSKYFILVNSIETILEENNRNKKRLLKEISIL